MKLVNLKCNKTLTFLIESSFTFEYLLLGLSITAETDAYLRDRTLTIYRSILHNFDWKVVHFSVPLFWVAYPTQFFCLNQFVTFPSQFVGYTR